MKLTRSTKRAITGGVISMTIMLLGTFLLGELSGYEAKSLIKNSIAGVNTLCNTIALASATILALLLTILGVSSGSESKLKKDHYKHILLIARLDTIVFVSALISFLIFSLPVTEFENVPEEWFSILYYTTLGISSVLSAAIIVVVLMLYNTLYSIIKIVGLGLKDHPLLETDSD
ncbi:hypothetical protein [Maribacter aestuarii]|uniref:hypothetical protein n=1 Tax=Maribacter aestuarii TaxID=1130723 RepID=UPI00248B28DA|nr:hypothetical protein [Maribacter aestuarii]